MNLVVGPKGKEVVLNNPFRVVTVSSRSKSLSKQGWPSETQS